MGSRISHSELCSYCAICGGPITENQWLEEWLADTILLSDSSLAVASDKDLYIPEAAEELMSDDGIYEIPATPNEDRLGVEFFIPRNHQIRQVYNVKKRDGPLLIPVHQVCLKIAKRFIKTSTPPRAKSMQMLWQILQSRVYRTILCQDHRSCNRILEPRSYYMQLGEFGMVWAENDSFEHELYEANPIEIKDLSTFIAKYLHPLQSIAATNRSQSHLAVSNHLEKIPQEVLDNIIQQMLPLENIPLQCTRLLAPAHWQKLLLYGNAAPYLWDLDPSSFLKALTPSQATESEWDFERLVRQLFQVGFWEHEAKTSRSKIPLELRNRRIWRLLEDMRIGDAKMESDKRLRKSNSTLSCRVHVSIDKLREDYPQWSPQTLVPPGSYGRAPQPPPGPPPTCTCGLRGIDLPAVW